MSNPQNSHGLPVPPPPILIENGINSENFIYTVPPPSMQYFSTPPPPLVPSMPSPFILPSYPPPSYSHYPQPMSYEQELSNYEQTYHQFNPEHMFDSFQGERRRELESYCRGRSSSRHERKRDNERKSRDRRYSRSPSRGSHRRSPSRGSHRSPSRSSHRSPSHGSHRSPSRGSHRSRSPSRHLLEREKFYREKERFYAERAKRNKEREREREYKDMRERRSLVRRQSPPRSSRNDRRSERRSSSRQSSSSSRHSSVYSSRDSRTRDTQSKFESSKKDITDREKILEEYRKNFCNNPNDIIKKMEQWSKEHNSDNEEEPEKVWYRSSPAELFYKQIDGGNGVEQTPKLMELCQTFRTNLIDRGKAARPEVDELPPLKPMKSKTCKHNDEDKSSSSESEDSLDEDGMGYNDRVMQELQRKQSHPRRLHPEMWFNNRCEMNGGPLCRCSARARRFGLRHGVYAGEAVVPRCVLTQSNIKKLFHYRITVSPPTNFLIKTPTIIGHDEHEFLFSGFSMFTHYKLTKLPKCKVIRFNIEYTILYIEEPAPQNFTVEELDLFEEYLFYELLELVDLDLGKPVDGSCSQFHFMPRFVRSLPENGCEILSMCEVLKYLVAQSKLLVAPDKLKEVHKMDHYTWQKFVDTIKGMLVTYPGKKPCSVRVDQIDRSPPTPAPENFYPEVVHFGIRPPQLSYAGNPEYQKAWRYYVKYRHLVANMAKPSSTERQRLAAKEANLQQMRTQSKMKRDVTVAISSEGFYTTGLMCDVVQHAMLIPVLVRHLRFHKSLESLESRIGYVFKCRALLQTALTHPSYRENFGTNPDHARNSLTNCGIRQPEYGDRKIHYTRKKGIVTLINIMSRFGKHSETESAMKNNERLEFLGDAVVEFLSSIHLFRMFPGLAEGGLATYRAAIVQNQHLAQLAKNIGLEQFMLYAHGSDLCRDVVMRHAMANCFEALMAALYLDGGLEVADKVFALALWHDDASLLDVWMKDRPHPLQEQEPLGDRKYIKDFEFLQKLTRFEESVGVQFKHIRLLARAFTDRSVGFTNLTLGSNQRLEFLGDTVLQLVVSDKLYKHFPEHHEGHLSLLRSSLVNNRTQSLVCDDLGMAAYAIYNNPKAKPTTKKHKADLLEAFLGALYIDKNMEYCQVFCMSCLFPRLQEFILRQEWNDPKSKLQQCCLTLRSVYGGEPDIPHYKVIECLGPTNTRVYTVAVYFRGARLATARGHSIQEAEMQAAEVALSNANELFPQLDHQKRVMAKGIKERISKKSFKFKFVEDKVPLAYKDGGRAPSESSDENFCPLSGDENNDREDEETGAKSDQESGIMSDCESVATEQLPNVKVSSLLNDMEKLKEDFIRRNVYDKLKEKSLRMDFDEDID